MKRLVECGLNIDVPEGRFEQSAAHLAAFAGHVDVLQWLLENGSSAQKVVSTFSYNVAITVCTVEAPTSGHRQEAEKVFVTGAGCSCVCK